MQLKVETGVYFAESTAFIHDVMKDES